MSHLIPQTTGHSGACGVTSASLRGISGTRDLLKEARVTLFHAKDIKKEKKKDGFVPEAQDFIFQVSQGPILCVFYSASTDKFSFILYQ